MSASHPPVFVSVTKLEYRERNVSDDNVACYLFLNSRPISVFKTSDPHHFVSISSSSSDDILQFIFQTDEQNEAIGCVSFMMKHLINYPSPQCSQWVTLFDDPEDDIFDGILGENDEEWPRALISFDFHEDKSLNISKDVPAQDKEKVEDTLTLSPLKEVTQETLIDLSGDLASQRSHYPPVFNEQNNNNTSFKLHLVPTTMDVKSEKGGNAEVDIFPDFPSSENPLPMEKEILYQSGGGTQEVVSQPDAIKHSIFKEKPATGEKKKRKETFGDSFEFTNEEKNMAEMKMMIENLEREKNMLKKNEQTYHLKLNHSRIEVEKLKFNKENYENTIKELQNQLAQEKAMRILLEKEKDHHQQQKKQAGVMSERKDYQKQINESDSPNQLKCYEPLFSHKERKYKEEIESLHRQIMQLKNECKMAKTQVECDESIIQNLQKEIYALREKESHPQNTPDDKNQEHYDKLIDICSTHFQISKFDTLEEFIAKVQSELITKSQETLELKNINEGLQIKLSVCDNKILADSLWNQINSFKQLVSTLEKERDKLKSELSKTNENYIRLTNKYTELTDVLADLQKPVQRLLKSGSKASVSPTPNRRINTQQQQQQTSRFDRSDETELRLIEFISQYKLQPSLFQRVDKGVYMYNRRQVFLRLVKGKLVVKIGVGYKPLQEFLRIEEPYERTPPRQTRLNTDNDDKSFDGRYAKHNKSEIVLATEPSYRDYSIDHPTTSGSFIRENLRDLSYREYDRDDEKSRKKSSRVKDKFQEITSSKSVERRISFNLYQPQSSRNSGRLTPI